MHVGTLTFALLIPGAQSLKDKRHVVKSLVETARRKFNVSVAEVEDLDVWRRATIGVACVSNDAAYTNRVLDKVLDYFESEPAVSVAGVELEML